MDSLLSDLPRGLKVLDCPAGTGRFFDLFRGYEHEVTAVDSSADMLTQADVLDGVKIQTGDARRLPFASDAFDLVVSVRFLQHVVVFRDAEQALREFARVTRNFAIVQLDFRVAGWCGPVAWHRRRRRVMANKLTTKQLKGVLVRCGFEIIRILGPLNEQPFRQFYFLLRKKQQASTI